jgi:hypothetical protein
MASILSLGSCGVNYVVRHICHMEKSSAKKARSEVPAMDYLAGIRSVVDLLPSPLQGTFVPALRLPCQNRFGATRKLQATPLSVNPHGSGARQV